MTAPNKHSISNATVVSVTKELGTSSGPSPPAKTEALAKLRDFYDHIYRPAFPDQEETEVFEDWIAVLCGGGEAGYTLHPELVVSSEGRVLAGLLWEHYERSNAVLATYLATAPSMRRRGTARLLVDTMAANVRDIGKASGQYPVVYAELRDPKRARPDVRVEDEVRLNILDKLGFRLLDCDYLQPPLAHGGPYCDHLRLTCLHSSVLQPALPASEVERFLDDFFACLALRTGALPSQEWRAMMARLQNSLHIALLPLHTLLPHTGDPAI